MPSCQIAFSSACKVAVAASGPAHQRLAHVVHHVAAPFTRVSSACAAVRRTWHVHSTNKKLGNLNAARGGDWGLSL